VLRNDSEEAANCAREALLGKAGRKWAGSRTEASGLPEGAVAVAQQHRLDGGGRECRLMPRFL